MTIDLYQLIRSGSLEVVQLGMSRAEVETILGAPTDKAIRRKKSNSLTRHGPLELEYEVGTDKLVCVYVKTTGDVEIPDELKLEGYEQIKNATMAEFQKLLESLGVGYKPVRPYMEPHQYDWLLDSGVTVIFEGESRTFDQMSIDFKGQLTRFNPQS